MRSLRLFMYFLTSTGLFVGNDWAEGAYIERPMPRLRRLVSSASAEGPPIVHRQTALHDDVQDLLLDRFPVREVLVSDAQLRFQLYVDPVLELPDKGPHSLPRLLDSVEQALSDGTDISLGQLADVSRFGKRLEIGPTIEVVLTNSEHGNQPDRFPGWTDHYIPGVCGSSRSENGERIPGGFSGMSHWMGWHRRALILVASDDLEELDVTLAHEVTHYWYARLGLQGVWEVPAGTEERIHTGCTSRHLEWFRANGESVTDYWRNQAYAEITELEMERRVAMGTHR